MPFLFILFFSFANWAVGQDSIPNYPCYRTVESTFATAKAIVEKHPNLAEWIDIGDSWEKTAGEGGWDLMVLRLTNRSIPGPKPKLFAQSSIHAREYATAELLTRFAEQLVNGYGTDPDITWMLDYQEAHFLFFVNPDGRKKAEPQVMWRKNANRAYCGTNSSNRGVDLNRNYDYQWGSAGASSQCDETYRGPKAASEPEIQAVQNYLRKLFADKKPNATTPVPLDYEGINLDIHSYGEIIYQPLGSPNHAQLTSLNRKFAYYNGHRPILSREATEIEREATARSDKEFHGRNTSFVFGYGDLGVPSYLIELGTAFFQSCNYFESNILPGNLKALTFAMKVVKAPYTQPSGPEVIDLKISQNSSTSISLVATLDDTRFSTKSGTEATQNIIASEVYLHIPPWRAGARAIQATAVDGKFDAKQEAVTAIVDTTGLEAGRHIIFVRGKDAAGNWGPIRAGFFQR
jgi:carboxypeptidase T